jgi:hypothetical protein
VTAVTWTGFLLEDRGTAVETAVPVIPVKLVPETHFPTVSNQWLLPRFTYI